MLVRRAVYRSDLDTAVGEALSWVRMSAVACGWMMSISSFSIACTAAVGSPMMRVDDRLHLRLWAPRVVRVGLERHLADSSYAVRMYGP